MSTPPVPLHPRDAHTLERDSDEELAPSVLGTKQYWEECYDDELSNFREHGDSGENWFGESITRKLITWLCENITQRDTPVLDLGCGNGLILTRLRKEGFTKLVGVDYSEKAIDLATSVSADCGAADIRFKALDILADRDAVTTISGCQYGVVLDKGTYDAICLMPDADVGALRREYYLSVVHFLSKNGTFVITSCNWTREELLKHFAFEGSDFILFHEIVTPSLSFGGKQGNQVTCLIFTKRCQ